MTTRNPTALRKRQRANDGDEIPSDISTSKRQRTKDIASEVLTNPPKLISSATKGTPNSGRRAVFSLAKQSAGGDPWEIPDSDSETPAEKPPAKGTAGRGKNTAPGQRSRVVLVLKGKDKDKGNDTVYDFPGSDDELSSTNTAHSVRSRKGLGMEPRPPVLVKAQVGRPLKGKKRREAADEGDKGGDDTATVDTPAQSRSLKKPSRSAVKEGKDGASGQESAGEARPRLLRVALAQEASASASAGRWQKSAAAAGEIPNGNYINQSLEEAVPGSSGKRGEGRKATVPGKKQSLVEAEEDEKEAVSKPTAKRGRGRPRKNPAPTKEKKPSKEPTKEDDEADKDEEEETCAICFRPDSERGNQIVFCDNCDAGYHQKCCGLTVIPKGDWICKKCSQEKTVTLSVQGKPVKTATAEKRPEISNFEQHLVSMQRVLLDRCTGRRRIRLRGQEEAYEKARALVEQTVAAGEGNSMMVIGARGCGKTTLVESVIADMTKHYKSQFHIVRLNGFIHTDDKLALREIWRQLGKEMEVEDEIINKTNNHADTMASLLAVLSHPSEISADAHLGITSKSVIFIIDEFDLFATHARQTLLYNLFDIAQARKAPIAVLGLTTRIDVVEGLEKRVKSRFSHRYVYLSLPKSLPAYWDVCRQGLSIDDEDMVSEGLDPKLDGHKAFYEWWNARVEALGKMPSFQDHLESHFYSSKSVSAFLSTCILPLSALSASDPGLRIPSAEPLASLEPADSKLQVLEALSELDLAMLIAAARLDIVADTDTVNFAMAYDEYASLMGRQRVQSAVAGMTAGGGARVWGRSTAGMAWERLVMLGLLTPAATFGRGAAGQTGLDAKMWKVDVALEEIPAAVRLNTMLGKWCREI